MKNNIIFSSIRSSAGLLLKNKSMFALLFIIQFLFITFFIATQTIIQPKIISLGIDMIDYMENLENEPVDLGKDFQGIFGKDPLLLYRNSKEIGILLLQNILITLALFLILVNSAWVLSLKIIKSVSWKKSLKNFFNFIKVSFIFLLPYSIIVYFYVKDSILKSVEKDLNLQLTTLFILILTFLVWYFIMISYSLVHLPLKEMLRKTFLIGIRKAHIILLTYFISLAAIILVFFVMFLTLEINFFLFMVLAIVFIKVYNLSRIFIIDVVNSLEQSLNKS
ncbi:MAG: hypothetical protein V1740_00260 [Candidatus Woesearchaeota archaeon]